MTPERWRQITSTLHDALARESGARARFLDEACAGDAELRSDVESLLARARETPAVSMVGRTLLHYRILEALGAGGMGEVYAAEDTKLRRVVALKLLPQEMAREPERLQRFRREAQALAALNHPNIVTLYDVEEADGRHFLTMELVLGKTLAEVRPPGGLPLRELLGIFVPLAEAISAAHQRGVVHRDLKPTNVMLSHEGRLKVLDFGLAKLRREEDRAPESATWTASDLTAEHHVIGTASYMSPEQAQGEPVDLRSDVFSLGVVLYELATGIRPFRGKNAVSIISAVLRETPAAPAELNPALPPDLDRIIRRCLAKDPARRYQTAADLRNDLEELQEQLTAGRLTDSRRRPTRTRGVWLAIGAGLVAVVAAIVLWLASKTPAGRPLRAEFSQITSQPGVEWFPSLSPDGKWVVYAGTGSGNRRLYLQGVGGQNPIDLSGDSSAEDDQPAFSPDGERIAFRSSRDGGGIFVMGRTGEAVRRITRVGFGPAWSPDGKQIAFASESVDLNPQNSQGQGPSQLWVADAATGETRRLNEGDAFLPSWSPHNRRIAFSRRLGTQGQQGSIWSMPVAGGEATRVTGGSERNWNPAWSPDGKQLYFVSDRGGSMNLWRIAIDEVSGTPQGEAEPLTTPAPFLAHASLSADGRHIAYTSAQVTTNIQRVAFDPASGTVNGAPEWVTTGSRRWANPDPSPDGEWVVFYSLTQPEGDLYLARRDGTGLRQLTSDAAVDRVPRWSPDGKWIACFSTRSGRLELWKIRPDGSDLQQLTEGTGSYLAWSPDGSRMAVLSNVESPDLKGGPYLFDPNRPRQSQAVERLPWFESPKRMRYFVNSWSPDGTRLAGGLGTTQAQGPGIATYSLKERRYERVSDLGEWPVWLPDSRRLMFVSGGNSFHVVDTRTKETKKVFSVARDVIGPPRLSRDGKTIFYSRRVTEADIWLVTLK